MSKLNKNFVIVSVFLGIFVFLVGVVSAANCWEYTQGNNESCTAANGCFWDINWDGSEGWCNEIRCWDLDTQNECTTTAISGSNCTWEEADTWNYCGELQCWGFEGTDEATCVNNTAGISCNWETNCFNLGGGSADCWNIDSQNTCLNTTGCGWGQCQSKGCWNYAAEDSCNAALNPWGNHNNCTWNGASCNEASCGSYANQTGCNAASIIDCEWKTGQGGGWCQEASCSSFNAQTSCNDANTTHGIDCNWDGGWCRERDCWDAGDADTCGQRAKCIWTSSSHSAECNEVSCWQWDSNDGGGESACTANASIYGLNCQWQNFTDNSGGWCETDYSSTNCTSITTEYGCYDTFNCWWQFTDPSSPELGGSCTAPTWGTGNFSDIDDDIVNDWNPGCYIFDSNSTLCNATLGCTHQNTGECDSDTSGDYLEQGTNITNDGIRCTYINDSGLCNDISVLSSCCSWQSGNCTENKETNSCWNDIEETPNGESSCDDANLVSDVGERENVCNQLAGSWFWPCKWDNTTSNSKCTVKTDDIWGNRTPTLTTIENRITCEAVGGKWVIESYCEGNIAIPSGRCEYKFDEERNCNKACYACEYRSDGTSWNNLADSKGSCLGSTLGTCEFTQDSSAPNAYGYCNAKKQFKTGVAEECDSNCGACTHFGDPLGINGSKTPENYCVESRANLEGGGCQWINDTSTSNLGYCIGADEKTCEDVCDRCDTRNDCVSVGRTDITNGTAGSCKWQGTDNDGNCVANIAGEVEICWNGEDDDDDGLVDCADPYCYSDSFCGFVEGGCFNWPSNATCADNGCEWFNDTWSPTGWCDFPGSQCWKSDGNETLCTSSSRCEWQNSSGDGWCEKDWSSVEICFSANAEGDCNGLTGSGCVWTNDTWCDGQEGNSSTWCSSAGGWCEHNDTVYHDCWQHYGSSSCNSAEGCAWRVDLWSTSQCEVNWSANCWDLSTEGACTAESACEWASGTHGSWCRNKFDGCYGQYTENDCSAVSGVNCNWRTYGGGGGTCEPSCYNITSQNSCTGVTGCLWKDEVGWCEEESSATCYNSTSTTNQSNCEATDGCNWRDPGWCNPAGGFNSGGIAGGGGTGGSQGSECYKYDGNQSACTNETVTGVDCGWFGEDNPTCEPDWSADCWQYENVAACNGDASCWWNPDGWGDSSGWCGNAFDQCWSNTTLQSDSDACNTNSFCNSTGYGCEPTCFGVTSEATCGTTTSCKWMGGWCNPAGMTAIFDEIEGGAPVSIGSDICDGSEISQASVDICNFGMKDMGDAYGFGAFVANFINSSVCNKEQVHGSHLGGSDGIGSGNDTVRFIVYLDTDGSTSGSCSLVNDASAKGYEFRFRYASDWNGNTSKAIETFTAYKCENSNWKIADIKISVWKKLMCSELGGPMIAIEKGELSRFPTLYDSTEDMRVYVATVGDGATASSPSDVAGPGWATPGAIDFEISSAFAYGADSSKFEDILKKGFVQGEDCFTAADDDNDGNVNCADWDCQFSSQCTGTGVNSDIFVDTRMPQVSGVRIEEYEDAALIIYDTNKPANGTLLFYNNDSTCKTLNSTIVDVGTINDNVRTYKLWHTAELYNDTGISSLNYDLVNDTTYYYKLKICDDNGKCSQSKCSPFTTAPVGKCGFCDFVTRIKVSSDWTVSYDQNQDGIYEHIQGGVCGPTAGMKTNHTEGRRVNIKLEKSDSSAYFEFINSSLTKTGLNDKVRTISSSGDIIGSGEIVGLTSETRDKIINNLYPEACRIKIPYSGSCDSLFHCDDAGSNCVDRTADSTLIDSENCVWQVPFCEFSTYREAEAAEDGGSSGGSSSGGGGGGGGEVAITSVSEREETEDSSEDGFQLSPEVDDDERGTDEGKTVDKIKEGISSKNAFWIIVSVLVAGCLIGSAYGFNRLKGRNLKKGVKVKSGKNVPVR